MFRPLHQVRTALLGGAALALLGTAPLPVAAAAATPPRELTDRTQYTVRHAPSDDRMVPSGWSKDATTVVSWGGYRPAGEPETWQLVPSGLTTVHDRTFAVDQIRNATGHDQCLEIDDSVAHSLLYQRPCSVNNPAQKWILVPSPTTTDAYRIVPLNNPDLAVAPQHPTSHWSYLWLEQPGEDADWFFDYDPAAVAPRLTTPRAG